MTRSMEDLLKEQKAELEEFNRLVTNYNKDGATRKNQDYLHKKLTDINEKYGNIKKRDGSLQQYETNEQPYFAENLMGKAKEAYDKVISDIITRLSNVDKLNDAAHTSNVNGNGVGESHDTTINNLSMMQVHKEDIMDLIASAEGITVATSRGHIQAHVDVLQAGFSELRNEIQYSRSMGEDVSSIAFPQLQASYLATIGKLNEILGDKNRPITSAISNSQFSLPKLTLPQFSGNVSEWKGFISLFDRMIHNNVEIDNGLKIEYLKSCLKGEAFKIISHIDATPDNYTTCYDLLRKRYENKRLIMGKFLDNILNIKKMQSEDADQLKCMHDIVQESIMSIKNLNVNVENWDPLLTHILVHKLDSNTVVNYECQLKDVREPLKLHEFLAYIENRFLAIQSANSKLNNFANEHNNKKVENTKKPSEKNVNCLFCASTTHSIYKCDSFTKQSVNERINWAKTKTLCLNCLATNKHKTHECKSTYKCKYCQKKHNSLLHLQSDQKSVKANAANISENETENVNACIAANQNSVMLATAIVSVEAKSKEKIAMRALIDQGSQRAFITENAVQTLGLKKHHAKVNVTGIGAITNSAHYYVEFLLMPRFKSNFNLHVQAIVLEKITHITNECDNLEKYDHLVNLLLADPSLHNDNNGKVDILLGSAEHAAIIKNGLIKVANDQPIAQNTELGWLISGIVNASASNMNVTSLVTNVELNEQLKLFFQNEDIVNNDASLSEEEEYCEQHYKNTHYRDEYGRYVVQMPFKNGGAMPELGDSRKCAIATQFQLERRFEKNEKLRIEYKKFIDEYCNLNHMQIVPYDNNNNNFGVNFLPHHCVFKESTTTKLRVVCIAKNVQRYITK